MGPIGRTRRRRPGPVGGRLLCAVAVVVALLLPGFSGANAGSATPSARLVHDSGPAGRTVPTATPGLLPDDWPTYGATAKRSGNNANETVLSPADAGRLQLAWMTRFNDTILGSLIVANGTVYVGDRSGYLAALNASYGAVDSATSSRPWSTPFLGNSSYSRCGGSSGPSTKLNGLIATPTLLGNRIYENGGNTSFYTLSLAGQVLQRVDIGNHTTKASPWYFDYNWGSPLVYHGFAYVGIAAMCEFNDGDPNSADWKYVQGQLVQVNLTSGTVTATWNATKGTSTSDMGGSIWSTPAVDPTTNTVWVTTGNMNNSAETPANGEYPQSTVALNATTLKFLGGCQVGVGGFDADFGAGPTLFTDGKGGRYVGAINKDGVFSAYNATTPGGGNCGSPGSGKLRLAWSDAFCAGTTPGTISPAAWDGQFLYIASDGCTNSSGYVDQVYPSNGTVRWSHSMYSPSSEAHAGVAAADGLVVIAANSVSGGNIGPGELQVLNATNGALLYHHGFFAETNAWPVVAEGTVFLTVGNVTNTDPGFVAAFRVPFSTTVHVGNAACTGSAPENCTTAGRLASFTTTPVGGMPPYTCRWTFGDGNNATGCAVAHTYGATGSYSVNGTFVDGAGSRTTAEIALTVAAATGAGGTPPARTGAVFVDDPSDHETVLFGGLCAASPCTGRVLNDTWVFSGGHWANLTAELYPAPPPTAEAAAAFDPTRSGVLVYGGMGPNGSGPPVVYRDLWEFSNGAWSRLNGSASPGPPPIAGASAAFAPDPSGFAVFGGLAGPTPGLGIAGNATWIFANGSWSESRPRVGPSPRTGAGLTYDPSLGGLLLFGGLEASGTALNDTWLDRAGVWSRISTTSAPAPGSQVVLQSEGAGAPDLLWDGAFPNTTWEFTGSAWVVRAASVHPAVGEPGAPGTELTAFDVTLVLDGGTTWSYANGSWSPLPPVPTIHTAASTVVNATVSLNATVSGGVAPFAYRWGAEGAVPSNGSGSNLTTRFPSFGVHAVTLAVSDRLGEIAVAELNLTVSAPVGVGFAQFPTEGEVGLGLNFSATSFGGVGGSLIAWTFGDGSSGTRGPAVVHTYQHAGSFVVNATAFDRLGDHATVSRSVPVAPEIRLGGGPEPGPYDAGQSVPIGINLTGGVAPYTVLVFFGDGDSVQLTWNASPSGLTWTAHAYGVPGRFNVTCLALDALGAASNWTAHVGVNDTLRIPLISAPSSLPVGQSGTFGAEPAGGSPPYTYAWSFGDSATASMTPAGHAYAAPGTYTVRVTVADAAGQRANATASIIVSSRSANGITGTDQALLLGGGIAVVATAGLVWVLRRRRPPER